MGQRIRALILLVVLVGAGVGIAPIHFAAHHHKGPKRVFIGARTAAELSYWDAARFSLVPGLLGELLVPSSTVSVTV